MEDSGALSLFSVSANPLPTPHQSKGSAVLSPTGRKLEFRKLSSIFHHSISAEGSLCSPSRTRLHFTRWWTREALPIRSYREHHIGMKSKALTNNEIWMRKSNNEWILYPIHVPSPYGGGIISWDHIALLCTPEKAPTHINAPWTTPKSTAKMPLFFPRSCRFRKKLLPPRRRLGGTVQVHLWPFPSRCGHRPSSHRQAFVFRGKEQFRKTIPIFPGSQQ